MELTLTVPLTITLPNGPGANPALEASGRLKSFDVNCAVGSNLGYATGVGAQGQIVGTGSTSTSGTKTVLDNTGKLNARPQATVIITYDDGVSASGIATGAGGKPVPSYLCWVQWQTPIPSLAPIFVQGTLNAH
jgi:hypothetical protein